MTSIKRKPRSYLRTDSGNAEMFAAFYGKRVKFDHKQGRWLIWSEKRSRWTGEKQCRWAEDKQGRVRSLMKLAVRQLLRGAFYSRDKWERNEQIKWALKSESRYGIDAALELARSIAPVSDDGEKWDSNPWLLGVGNGVVDLRTGRRRTARAEDYITRHLPTLFDADAKCPRFERFIAEICNGDQELVSFLQRAVGYSLTGCVHEHCFFCCYGTGANGKSTLLGVLHHIFGDYAVNLPFTTFEVKDRSSISNDLAMLAGRRFATALETSEGVRLNEARIKTITGGDPITARHLYHENFTFIPTHKLWLAVNHKPHIADESEGMWRRVRLIPFKRQFRGAERDKRLLDALKAEASGILAWAVHGALLWQKHGLEPPQTVTEATIAYRQESDQIGHFIEECCLIDADATVTSADLWARYQRWSFENGEPMLSQMALAERLKQRGFTCGRFGHVGTRGWRGLRLANKGHPGEAGAADEVPSLDEFDVFAEEFFNADG